MLFTLIFQFDKTSQHQPNNNFAQELKAIKSGNAEGKMKLNNYLCLFRREKPGRICMVKLYWHEKKGE